MKFFVMMEPGTHIFLRRYFVWHKNTYFSNNLPKNAVIYLSECDEIVNSKKVAEYLSEFPGGNRTHSILKGHSHGGFLVAKDFTKFYNDLECLESIQLKCY